MNNQKITGYKLFVVQDNSLLDIVFLNKVCNILDAKNKEILGNYTYNQLNYGEKGFHFCVNLNDCLNYIGNIRGEQKIVCRVECNQSDAKFNNYNYDLVNGYVCSKYKIVKVMSKQDIADYILTLDSQRALLTIYDLYNNANELLGNQHFEYLHNRFTSKFIASYNQKCMDSKFKHIMDNLFYDKKIHIESIKDNREFINNINQILGYWCDACICQHLNSKSNKLGKQVWQVLQEYGPKGLSSLLPNIIDNMQEYIKDFAQLKQT